MMTLEGSFGEGGDRVIDSECGAGRLTKVGREGRVIYLYIPPCVYQGTKGRSRTG